MGQGVEEESNRMRTYNTTQVAKEIGVSRWTIGMFKRMGLRFDCGNRTTVEHVIQWMKDNPDRPTTFVKLQKPHDRPDYLARTSSTHEPLPSGRSGGRSSKRGSRVASPQL